MIGETETELATHQQNVLKEVGQQEEIVLQGK